MHPYIDTHSHLLPGLDDGISVLAETLESIQELKKLGFGTIFCTPHQKEGSLNPPWASVKAVFSAVQEEVGGRIRLHLAAENYYDPQFYRRVQEETVPTYGGGDWLLFEGPPYDALPHFDAFVFQLSMTHYRPVLAHVERYDWIDLKHLKLLHRNLHFQVNITGFVEAISTKERFSKVNTLLERGLIDFLATDLHSKAIIPRVAEGMNYIDTTYGRATLDKLLSKNPRKILKSNKKARAHE